MSRREVTIRLTALLVLPIFAAPAAAQPGNQASVPPAALPGGEVAPALPPEPAPAWYGWQLLAADGLALAGGTLLAEFSDLDGERGFGDRIGATWALGMFGSVAVHAANRRPLVGLASVSERLLIPPVASVFGIAGYCVATEIKSGCAGTGARWGFAVGVGTAALIDAVALSQNRLGGSRGWYGSSLLVVDAIGLGLGLYALGRVDDGTRTDDVLALGASHYLVSMFAAPWVHGGHGHWLRALGSFGLRSLTPGVLAAAGVAGYCAASGGSDGCSDQGAAFGLALGSLLAATIDVAVLGWEERSTSSHRRSPQVAPYIRPGERDGVEAGFLVDISPWLSP